MNTAAQSRDNDALKGGSARGQSTTHGAQVKWGITAKYGLGRDEYQFIVYRARTPKSADQGHKPRSDAVAFFTSLEGALMWIVMRQAHFEDEPTIDTDILGAFQRYCHHLDQIKADITALAQRIEAALS